MAHTRIPKLYWLTLISIGFGLASPLMAQSTKAPVLHYHSQAIIDPPPNNRDRFLEPRERDSLRVYIINNGVDTARNVSAVITTASPCLSILSGASYVGNIPPGDSACTAPSFFVTASKPNELIHHAKVHLDITAGGGYNTLDSFAVDIGTPGFYDDVEDTLITNLYTGTVADWAWHLSTSEAYSPTHSWMDGALKNPTHDTVPWWHRALETPSIFIIQPYNNFTFWNKRYFDNHVNFIDSGIVEYSSDSGTTWHQITLFNGPAVINWIKESFTLPLIPSCVPFQVRFNFAPDMNHPSAWWTIDEILVGRPLAALLLNGQVAPASGGPEMTYSYQVTYRSPLVIQPTEAYVDIDGAPHVMTYDNGVITSGAAYKYQTSLSPGQHDYRFRFIVDSQEVYCPDSGTYTGPFVYHHIEVDTYSNYSEYVIPNGDFNGISSYINVPDTFHIYNLWVYLYIAHHWLAYIQASLHNPLSDSIYLHYHTGGSADSIIGWYPTEIAPHQSLSTFIGQPAFGQWYLNVMDEGSSYAGTLRLWRLVLSHGVVNGVTQPPAVDAVAADYGLAAYPNPFSTTTEIRYQLPAAGQAKITVYNLAGQAVSTLYKGIVAAGLHSQRWDGKNTTGVSVSAGVYVIRLEVGGKNVFKRLVLVK